MDSTLLETHVAPPPPPRHALPRPRLLDALEDSQRTHSLITVTAPAGYGKSTLLAQWARERDAPVAWLSLDTGDDEPVRLLRGVLAAWDAVQPGTRERPAGLLLGDMMPDREAGLRALLDEMGAADAPTAVVLDNFHLLRDPAAHEVVGDLLAHLPEGITLVLAGRAEPPLPLARMRAQGALREFGVRDLRFEAEETAAFLEGMGLEVPGERVARLQSELEGWIAGVQLAALALQGLPAGADLPTISGQHRYIADYLSEEVMATLPDDLHAFVLETSILDALCAPLCEAVTGRGGGQATLERLERENLFIVPLDAHREWFRYQRALADFLRGELARHEPERAAALHCRAARWYLSREQPGAALQHAVAGGDTDLAAAVCSRYVAATLMAGDVRTVERWLEAVPAAWQAAQPVFRLARAGVLMVTGQFEACAQCLDEVERLVQAQPDENGMLLRGRVNAMRCNIACFANDLAWAEGLAEEALRLLPEGEMDFRPGIFAALGDTYRRHGRWEEAEASYRKLLPYRHTPAFRVQAAHTYGAMADLSLRRGRLREAAGHWRQALDAIEGREKGAALPLPVTGWVYIRMGELLYEWNDLDAAADHLARGMTRAELGGDVRSLIAGHLLASRLALAQDDTATAEAALEAARPLVAQAHFSEWEGQFEKARASLWLAQGQLRTAVDWLEGRDGKPGDESAQLAGARVLIARGDAGSLNAALARLGRLADTAQAEGRGGVVVEALALQALAEWARGERAAAMQALAEALRLAEPEGRVRLFVDLGLPMARLLQDAHAREGLPGRAARLLEAFEADVQAAAPGARLPEPLTEREREVLALMAAGLTNAEIGEALVISPQTVKKHAGTIYGKLDVGNRTEAAARARELGWLD